MRLHLLEYIVQCLLVAGYDSVDAMSTINEYTIKEIEQYIEK